MLWNWELSKGLFTTNRNMQRGEPCSKEKKNKQNVADLSSKQSPVDKEGW